MARQTAWKKRRILIVDDDEWSRSFMAEVLSGCNLFQAASGEEALNLVNKGTLLDLVICDYNMSGANGVETIKQIRERLPVTKCILTSGSEPHELATLAKEAGAHAWIIKPFSDEDLLEHTRRLFTKMPSEN